ncbi:MAG: 7-cyano-7-deazaguanine synthase [Phycisphaerae bacterium]
MRKDRAVVLCSGGLNSAVLAAMARDSAEVTLLHATGPHPAAQRESDAVDRIAAHYSLAPVVRADLAFVSRIAELAAPPNDPDAAPPADGPAPSLAPLLLAAGEQLARAIGATRLWWGHCPRRAADAGKPDADTEPREFVQLVEHALAMTGRPRPLVVEAPFVDLSGGEVVKLARRLEVPMKLTWSCHFGGETPCGDCAGCRRRAAFFMQATIVDPGMVRAAVS